MPVTVRVSSPARRLIYINGAYAKAAGNSSDDTFSLPTGGHVFETLNGDDKVDFRKKFRIRRDDTDVTVSLEHVDPPERI